MNNPGTREVEPDFLSVKDFAQKLRVSQSSIKRWRKDGILPANMFEAIGAGRRIRIATKNIEKAKDLLKKIDATKGTEKQISTLHAIRAKAQELKKKSPETKWQELLKEAGKIIKK